MKSRFPKVLCFMLVLVTLTINCTKDQPTVETSEPEVPKTLREQYSTSSDKWPKAKWYDGIIQKELAAILPNPTGVSEEVLQLGKVLFFDNRLGNRNNSCASCHIPESNWIDKAMVATGGGNRNTPNLQNVWSLDGHLMLDGRAKTFAEQITIAIESPHEMNGKVADIPKKLSVINGYKSLFRSAYGSEEITEVRVLDALATFSKSIISEETAFDRFIQGEYNALNDQQLSGLHLFRTKAACINCHNGPYFTDLQYHNLGNAIDFERKADYGRANFTGKYSDWGKFRTPGLRNVAYTAPYMHNGSVESLTMMIDLLNEGMPQMNGQRIEGVLSPYIKPLQLTDDERKALLAFVNALSKESTIVERPVLPN